MNKCHTFEEGVRQVQTMALEDSSVVDEQLKVG